VLISLNWIKDFVTIPDISSHDIANDFTMKTAEVEDVIMTYGYLEVIKVAEIKSLTKHPEADKLNLVSFDFGGSETKEVVCGAPNVRVGLKVPFAALGTVLPDGFKLEPKKIRGILSDGMLCSEKELDLGDGAAGLMELPDDAIVGESLLSHLKMTADTIIDVDNKSLTHRPDLWGIYGQAREFSAIYGNALDDKFNVDWITNLESKFNSDKSPIIPKVDSDSACLAYYGLSVDGVEVKESPTWMTDRLKAVGLRPINNIVDISNYVMIELGMPLHIFDRDLIKDNTIKISRTRSDQNFETLDEVQRSLIATDTVISDSEKPLVIAGIMGGANSGVNDNTKSVFIEVANWKADEVRRTSTRLGLRTDSSARYEKSLDSTLCYRTLLRTLELVLELCPGAKVVGKSEYDGHKIESESTFYLETSVDKINAVLGTNIEAQRIIDIFESLDFKVEKQDSKLRVLIPTYRKTKDIECESDLVEEIGRIIGYDNIESVSPQVDISPVRFETSKLLHRNIQSFMQLNGHAYEIMTYPLVGKKLLEKAKWSELNEKLVLVNSISNDADRMRPSLIPSILQAASLNVKNFTDFSLFELGRAYNQDGKSFCNEHNQLVICMYSKTSSPFMELVNTTERLLSSLSISYNLEAKSDKFKNSLIPSDWSGVHPNEYLNIRVMGKFNGVINSVHPLMLRQFKIKGNLAITVIDFNEVEKRPAKSKIKYEALNKFPRSTFDCTVVASNDVSALSVLESLKKLKVKEMISRKIVDVFKLSDSENAITLRVFFEDKAQTLTSEFLKDAEGKVVQTLSQSGFELKA
jgi:phenylalanyl-tRNA synthetase beta chain